MSLVKRHPIITFVVLSYAISWAFLPAESVRFLPSGPLLAALIVIPITQGWAGLKVLGLRMIRWRVRWYWYVVAIGVPLAVHLANETASDARTLSPACEPFIQRHAWKANSTKSDFHSCPPRPRSSSARLPAPKASLLQRTTTEPERPAAVLVERLLARA